MNAIVSGVEKGERSEVYCLLGKYFYQGILFICSHITFPMIYSFYFLYFGSRRNECNSFWGEKEERSGVCYLLSSLCWTFFQVSLMKRWYCNLSLYMIHLSLYCRNTSFLSMRVIRCMMHISQQEYRDILELECTINIRAISLLFWKMITPLYFCCSLKRVPNLLDDTFSE